jgi:probable F420-dependent oxidoreductase
MTQRPFRFAISFGGNPTRSELVDAVKRAEDAGFSVVASADHLSSRLAVMPLLSTVAEVSSMRISPMVIANDYRHPAVLARDVATMDILSDGRFELGIGTGWIKEQYEAAGIAYDDPKTRVDRFEEAIQVIKGCWRGEPFTFTGRHYQTEGLTCPQPLQRPHPPLLIAGSGRRMLRIAGREADIVGISPLGSGSSGFEAFEPGMSSSADRIKAQISWISETAGPRFDEMELSVMAHHLAVGNDATAMAAELADSWGTTPDQVLESPHVFLGPTDQIVEVLLERRERYGISYVVFLGAHFELVEPIVERLAGS